MNLTPPPSAGRQPLVIIWDWDATLVDTFPLIHAAFNNTFKHFGLPLWTYEETKKRVAHSAKDAMPALFGAHAEEAESLFYEFYQEAATNIVAKEGRQELLAFLSERGHQQFVISNKRGPLLRKECEALGWGKFFSAIVGSTDAAADKPDPACLHFAYQQASTPFTPERAVYVGDGPVDAAFAKAAGVRCILLADETHTHAELQPHTPDVLLFSQLKERLVSL